MVSRNHQEEQLGLYRLPPQEEQGEQQRYLTRLCITSYVPL